MVIGVWNDVRNAAACPAVDAYCQSLLTSSPMQKPAPNKDCPATFGNSDIFAASISDPTPPRVSAFWEAKRA
jgi:hypothetical protein